MKPKSKLPKRVTDQLTEGSWWERTSNEHGETLVYLQRPDETHAWLFHSDCDWEQKAVGGPITEEQRLRGPGSASGPTWRPWRPLRRTVRVLGRSGWFGRTWLAPVCRLDAHVNTPVDQACGGCQQPILMGDQGVTIPHAGEQPSRRPYHLDCFLAMVGIGQHRAPA